jgi:hypothetical protein
VPTYTALEYNLNHETHFLCDFLQCPHIERLASASCISVCRSAPLPVLVITLDIRVRDSYGVQQSMNESEYRRNTYT